LDEQHEEEQEQEFKLGKAYLSVPPAVGGSSPHILLVSRVSHHCCCPPCRNRTIARTSCTHARTRTRCCGTIESARRKLASSVRVVQMAFVTLQSHYLSVKQLRIFGICARERKSHTSTHAHTHAHTHARTRTHTHAHAVSYRQRRSILPVRGAPQREVQLATQPAGGDSWAVNAGIGRTRENRNDCGVSCGLSSTLCVGKV
jgi:hypothetical protein